MSIIDNLLSEYAEKKSLYFQLQDDVEDIITSTLESNNISVSNVCFRVKSEKSLKKKIYYKNKYTSLDQITDILGCRILTLFESDIDKIYKILEQIFDIVEISDKRKKNDTSKVDFGYNSLHLIVKMSSKRCELVEYSRYKDIKFEIQLRTVLQHAWDEIEHGLGYKSTYEVPLNIRRNLNRLSGTLEILDEQFEDIRNDVEEYLASLNKKDKVLQADINKNSLINYVFKSEVITEINRSLAKTFKYDIVYDKTALSQMKIVEKLRFFGYEYINQLNDDIIKYKDDIVNIGKAWIKEFETDEQSSLNGFSVLTYFVFAVIKNTYKDITYPISKATAQNFLNTFYQNFNLIEKLNNPDSDNNYMVS